MTTIDLIRRAERVGFRFEVVPPDRVRLYLNGHRPDPETIAELRARKPQLLAALLELSTSIGANGLNETRPIKDATAIAAVAAAEGVLSDGGRLCDSCRAIARCFERPDGRRTCTYCAAGSARRAGDLDSRKDNDNE